MGLEEKAVPAEVAKFVEDIVLCVAFKNARACNKRLLLELEAFQSDYGMQRFPFDGKDEAQQSWATKRCEAENSGQRVKARQCWKSR